MYDILNVWKREEGLSIKVNCFAFQRKDIHTLHWYLSKAVGSKCCSQTREVLVDTYFYI